MYVQVKKLHNLSSYSSCFCKGLDFQSSQSEE